MLNKNQSDKLVVPLCQTVQRCKTIAGNGLTENDGRENDGPS